MTDLLQQIQQLQYTDRSRAEALLLGFIQKNFPKLEVASVALRPQAVSLNSFNGFLTLRDNTRLFFKTHTEQDNQISEYYNARLLAEAGYPVIQPLYSSTSAGQHLLIYEVIDSPSVFDVAWAIEQNERLELLSELENAQQEADRTLLRIYRQTLQLQKADEDAEAPIHQLFIHRLIHGRLSRFYREDKVVNFPEGQITIKELFDKRWRINGQTYNETLKDIIDRISNHTLSLNNRDTEIPSIIGHGDAHNGNVFFHQIDNQYDMLYFDPAFAGRHHPLLDLAKPIFHNVFAMWMYYPEVQNEKLTISLIRQGDLWQLEYQYPLPAVRKAFLQSKLQYVLTPIVRELKARNWLQENWREYFKAALFCCPFLTLDLTDHTRFPAEISLLGFAMSVEMGSESYANKSLIDQILDELQNSLIS